MTNENIKLSNSEKLAITSRTPDKMPINPKAHGWTDSQIKDELGKATLLLVDKMGEKFEEIYNTFQSIVETIIDVESLDDETLATGIYISGDDIIFHSATHLVQIGIIGGAFIFRTYVGDAWVEDSGVYEPSNPNIQEHIAIVDGNPHGVDKTDIGLGSVENYGIASQVEAEAGVSNEKYMTPLRTKQAIDSIVEDYYDKDTADDKFYTKTVIDTKVAETYKPKGNLSPAGLISDLLVKENLGFSYNMTGEFITDENFNEEVGNVYQAGTEVAIILYSGTHGIDGVYKFNVFHSSKTDSASVVYKETSDVETEIEELKEREVFNSEGTYVDLKVGLAYNIESQTPYVLDEAFDLRVTAGEDTEVKDGLAKVKELQAVVTQDGNRIITDITSKPNILVVTNDNWLKVVEGYSYTNKGITIEWLDENTLKFSGTATETDSFMIRPFVYSGLTENTLYDVEAKLYANVLSGDIESGNSIEFASAKLVGIHEYAILNLASQIDSALNSLGLSINLIDTVAINDLVVRFYTKHSSNPNQNFVFPNHLEHSLYTSELTEDDWFKDNVINYETKQFTKYWHKYVLDGSEAWELYSFANGKYSHFLPITEELTELASTTLIAQGRVGTATARLGGMMWAQGSLDGINGIIVVTSVDLATYKTIIGTNNLTIWVKFLTPTITQLTTIDNEILYPAYNYGLEFGLLDNKLKVEYSSDFQKQITTNLENIVELKATKAETYETSVTIETADWVADGFIATYKAIKTVNGVLSSDNPILAFDLDGIADTDWTASRTEFAKIGLANTTDDNEITFYASAIPSEDITVIIKVVR